MNIIYHPAALEAREKDLCEKEHELALKSYLNSIEREIIKEEKKKISQSKALKIFTIFSSFLAGFLSGIVF